MMPIRSLSGSHVLNLPLNNQVTLVRCRLYRIKCPYESQKPDFTILFQPLCPCIIKIPLTARVKTVHQQINSCGFPQGLSMSNKQLPLPVDRLTPISTAFQEIGRNIKVMEHHQGYFINQFAINETWFKCELCCPGDPVQSECQMGKSFESRFQSISCIGRNYHLATESWFYHHESF